MFTRRDFCSFSFYTITDNEWERGDGKTLYFISLIINFALSNQEIENVSFYLSKLFIYSGGSKHSIFYEVDM